jgi:hypothetical protein
LVVRFCVTFSSTIYKDNINTFFQTQSSNPNYFVFLHDSVVSIRIDVDLIQLEQILQIGQTQKLMHSIHNKFHMTLHLHIGADVRNAPRNAIVAADHNALTPPIRRSPKNQNAKLNKNKKQKKKQKKKAIYGNRGQRGADRVERRTAQIEQQPDARHGVT